MGVLELFRVLSLEAFPAAVPCQQILQPPLVQYQQRVGLTQLCQPTTKCHKAPTPSGKRFTYFLLFNLSVGPLRWLHFHGIILTFIYQQSVGSHSIAGTRVPDPASPDLWRSLSHRGQTPLSRMAGAELFTHRYLPSIGTYKNEVWCSQKSYPCFCLCKM